MRGLKAKDLVAIVDFIYKVEANIYQEDLDGFLALAEELQLTGLAGSTSRQKETPIPKSQMRHVTFLEPQDSLNENKDKTVSQVDIQNADTSVRHRKQINREPQDTWTEY